MNQKKANDGSEILRNLNKEIRRIKGVVPAGLRLAALLVKAESQKRTPVDTGNLRGSHYTRVDKIGSSQHVAEVGVTAEYGIYVHEDLTVYHPTGEAKFLERAVGAKAPEVLEILRRTAKVSQ
jgi:hypothetical protein